MRYINLTRPCTVWVGFILPPGQKPSPEVPHRGYMDVHGFWPQPGDEEILKASLVGLDPLSFDSLTLVQSGWGSRMTGETMVGFLFGIPSLERLQGKRVSEGERRLFAELSRSVWGEVKGYDRQSGLLVNCVGRQIDRLVEKESDQLGFRMRRDAEAPTIAFLSSH